MIGRTSGDVQPGYITGRIDPIMAPAMNWPSAPMFQFFERKQTDSPTAIRISGADLTAS